MSSTDQEKEIVPTPITMRNDRTALHTSPVERRAFDATPLPSYQSDTRYARAHLLESDDVRLILISSPHNRTGALPPRPKIPGNAHFSSSSSSTGTRTTHSQMNSYYSNSPTTRNNPFLRKNDLEHDNRDSSNTIYSSSHQSDSLYNEPTRQHTPRILTSSMNNRWKTTDSPSYNRKNRSPLPQTKDNDDEGDDQPRQILLPIGGGVIGKLASSTTNLSYRKCRFSSDLSGVLQTGEVHRKRILSRFQAVVIQWNTRLYILPIENRRQMFTKTNWYVENT